MFREAARTAAIAVPLGGLLAWAFGRSAQALNLLVGVTPTDLMSFSVPILGMVLLLAVASWWPAQRAASTDPARALRTQ